MKNNNFFTKSQVNGVMPHIENFFQEQLNIAKEEIKESKEYLNLQEEYLTTKDYEDYLNDLDENASEKFVEYVTFMIDTIYSKEKHKSLDKFINSIFYDAWPVASKLGISGLGSWDLLKSLREETQGCTNKNYKEIVDSLVNKAIDDNIESTQKQYADNILIKRYWASQHDLQKVKSIINTTNVCSNSELEQVVLNNFDFQELVKTAVTYNYDDCSTKCNSC